jgi:phosphopantetheine adenylyltransferase
MDENDVIRICAVGMQPIDISVVKYLESEEDTEVQSLERYIGEIQHCGMTLSSNAKVKCP